jgi:hypothetical protein
MRTCPYCAEPNREGVFFCEECGQPLFGTHNGLATSHLEEDESEHSAQGRITWGTARFQPGASMVVRFRDYDEPVRLSAQDQILLGRTEARSSIVPDLDMGPYGGGDLGVSRRHAVIQRGEDTLTLSDLGSTNGTYLNGQRLSPNQPRVVRDGDEIRLGKLVFHIFFD